MPTLHTSPSLARAPHTLTATTPPHAPGEKAALNFKKKAEKAGFSLDSKAHAAINNSFAQGGTT